MNFQVETLKKKFLEQALYIKKSENPLQVFGEIAFFLFLIFLTFSFFNNRLSAQNPEGVDMPFLHIVNLVFHEAGHVLLIPFGIFMIKLGGTILQCLIPLVLLIYFLRERYNFSASVMLWWFGQNFLDIAPYIYDAKRLSLPLLGGYTGRENPESHDWYWLLNRLGIRGYCESIGMFVEDFGFLLILLALTWSALLIYKRGVKEYPHLVPRLSS